MKKILVLVLLLVLIGCSTRKESRTLEIQALRECEVIEGEEYFFIKSSKPNSYILSVSDKYVGVMAGAVSKFSSDGDTTSIVIYPVEDFSVVRVLKSGVR